MNSFVTEIKIDDLNGYTLENSPVVIFISDKLDSALEEKEVNYKDLLTKYSIQHLFVYLDVSNEEILTKFNEKYSLELSLEKLPILVVIDEGKVVDYYSSLEYNSEDIVTFLEENEVIESD